MTRFLPILAIALAVLSAFASKPRQDCGGPGSYYWNGVTYVSAGILGTDYYCANGTGTCTYYQSGSTFTACQTGMYVSLHVEKEKR